MVKFKISGERFAEACNIAEYMLTLAGNRDCIIRIAPRFVTDDKGVYIVQMVHDEEGDIKEYQNMAEAFQKMASLTPKRIEKMIPEFMEAAQNIVNPPSGTV